MDRLAGKKVDLVINTPSEASIRRGLRAAKTRAALTYKVPYCTTLSAAKASATAIANRRKDKPCRKPAGILLQGKGPEMDKKTIMRCKRGVKALLTLADGFYP